MKRGVFDDDDDDDNRGKRRRPTGGFSDTKPPDADDNAEQQLDQMLSGRPTGTGFAHLGAAFPIPAKTISAEDPKKPATTGIDFSRLGANLPSQAIPVPKVMVEYLMTPEHRQILFEETGADVEWSPETAQVNLRGSPEQLQRANRTIQRVLMHCNWGRSVDKVRRILRPRIIESAVCRLSPMNLLPPGQKTLSLTSPIMSIGKDRGNDVVINAQIMSRQHCVLELDPERGAIYVIDCSTNGTFLNGVPLPPKTTGKVLVSHGDELLFQDPSVDSEFGYIINLQELNVKQQIKFEAPRRILSADETSTQGRDFA